MLWIATLYSFESGESKYAMLFIFISCWIWKTSSWYS